MQLPVVEVPTIKKPIQSSPGFTKKGLSDYKLDLTALCGFGCRYCSSNSGYYLRTNRERFADAAEQQIGKRLTPMDDPKLVYAWPEILKNLKAQIVRPGGNHRWGAGKTLVLSMQTDAFSPHLLKNGTTERALRMLLEHTAFRIRVLTKNTIVGNPKWKQFFAEYPERFVVGLSIGTLDDQWAKRVELNTSTPTARLRAHRQLQDAGVATYGMLCPVCPDVLEGDGLEQLVDAIRPEMCEHVWAEPFNDRQNWHHVRDGYEPGSHGHKWLTDVYEHGDRALWSDYAAELYERLSAKAQAEGWTGKLRYLLYESQVQAVDAPRFAGLDGVWLQAKADSDGRSRNPAIAAMQ